MEFDPNLPHIVIMILPSGQTQVSTNMPNELLALGAMEVAKKVIGKAYSKDQPNIVPAPASALEKL